jgi:hypothetical protein
MYTARIDLDDLQLERREFDGARFYAHTKRIEVALSEECSPAGVSSSTRFTRVGWQRRASPPRCRALTG